MSINRFPNFLLNYLDAKTSGVTPQEMSAGLVLSADIQPFYDADYLDTLTMSGGILTVGITQAGIIPAGAAWIPVAITFSWAVGVAGAEIYGRPVIGRPGFISFAPVGSGPIPIADGFSPGAVGGYTWEPQQRIVLPPGTAFGWEVFGTFGSGVVAASAQLYGSRIPLT